MADMLLSALIPIVMQKSADSLVQRLGEMWGIDDQREKLHDKLLAVQAVLINAEKQGDANLAVKSWLAKLKSAAYDADDVLDGFCYEELRREALRRGQKVGNVSDIFSRENPVLFRYKMSNKLKKVVGRIDDLVTEMVRFNFVSGGEERVVDRDRIAHSCVIESEVVGRKDDRENLVKLLTEVLPTENLMVLSIVGMGGLGKTTLAQLVYNDPRVKEHFKLLIWVCVSEEFDVGTITKSIIDHVIQKDCKVSCDNKDLLRSRLQKEISGKRYLLVLDDVWNENVDKWEQLRAILNCGDLGSTVLVTTRSGRVATTMGAVQCYNLGCLGEEDSWSLFQERAFSRVVKKELVGIGRKLVKNCGGLPIAIKTLGSLMSYKNEVRQWLAVLEQSTMWENEHSNDNDGVLSVLRLSYDHLPSYMKQCFAFCSIFPKDYVMEKEKLVQYWMAHGFIPSDRPGDLQMRGSDVFNELVWRSFFQDVKQFCHYIPGYHPQTTCKMHDLMHDLAQHVMRDECLSLLKPLQANNNLQGNIRHILLREFPKDINDVIQYYPTARTLIPDLKEHRSSYDHQKIGFVKSNFLRVLDLSDWFLRDTMITPRKMKHLRYLDLSDQDVTAIPEAITTLYLLQTLRLTGCGYLSTLPEGMRYMMSLQHLNIERCPSLKCMPPYLGELKYLQTLTRYIVGTGVGNKIGELKSLKLGGKLEVYNLKEVRDARDAREANMASKENLDHLALHWEMPQEYNGAGTVVADPFEVLDALKPCSNLKVLKINGYSADRFPDWMMEHQILGNLVELHINKCRRCTNVMQFHMLPLLQILEIRSMDNLRYLCCAEDAPITFPSLKSLRLEDMSNLDCWCEGDVGEETSLFFPMLREMRICKCPMLSAIPNAPLLERIQVIGNNILSCLAAGLTTLRSIKIGNGDERENNGTLPFKPWKCLEDLSITGFNHIIPRTDGIEGEELSIDVNATALRLVDIISSSFLFSPILSNSPLWLWKCFIFIEYLYISQCDSLSSWPEKEFSNLINLRVLRVNDCKNFLGSLSEPLSEMSSRQILLPKLEYLLIDECPNMVEVPKLPRSLKKFSIIGCNKLESLPEWLGSLVALKEVSIVSCKNLNFLPSSIGGLTTLEELVIKYCIKIASLPEGMQGLEALKSLAISDCPKIRVLPEGLLQRLRSLDGIRIWGCPLLERDFRKHGKYWHLISEIPKVYIGVEDRSSTMRDLTQLISSCKIPCLSAQS